MKKVLTLFYVALLGLCPVRGTPALETRAKAACVRRYNGTFITNQFTDRNGDEDNLLFKPFFFNKDGYVAYDAKNPEGYPKIKAEFQTCTPNYSGGSNKDDGNNVIFYGRFYVPKLNKCIAVTVDRFPSNSSVSSVTLANRLISQNLDKGPPYYVTTQTCPSAADMGTKKSIPFNFFSNEDSGVVDIHWIGGTIWSKKIYQGPDPPARYCGGEYVVNATNLKYGYNFPYTGEPLTSKSDNYRVHLYCNHKTADLSKGTAFQTFLVPVGPNSDPYP